MNRRGFLGAILAAGVAPAVVRAASLMPVRVLESDLVLPLPFCYGGEPVFRQVLRRMGDLERYEYAEFQAATIRAIACGLGFPYEVSLRDEIYIDGKRWTIAATDVSPQIPLVLEGDLE